VRVSMLHECASISRRMFILFSECQEPNTKIMKLALKLTHKDWFGTSERPRSGPVNCEDKCIRITGTGMVPISCCDASTVPL
jgi:hypothetical protein